MPDMPSGLADPSLVLRFAIGLTRMILQMKKPARVLSSIAVCGVIVNTSVVNAQTTAATSSTAPSAPATSTPAAEATADKKYKSPYAIKFPEPLSELTAVDQSPPRNDVNSQSSIPFEKWYVDATRNKFKSWGPPARIFSPPANIHARPLAWRQQRLIAVAIKYLDLPYQHHHIPEWNPPQSWPWKEVPYGRNSQGLDCSNFTSWVYNYALGIKFVSDVHKQAALTQVAAPGGKTEIVLKQIPGGTEYGSLLKQLQPGDLVFVRHKDQPGVVSHVVMWLGKYGQSPDGTPLIIDSTTQENLDCHNTRIPTGVQIRPFTPTSWYFKRFHHASRILQ